MEKRDSRLDVLRILSMLLVMAIHTANRYCRAYTKVHISSYLTAVTVSAAARISVPIFFMISGMLLLSVPYDRHKNLLRIKRRGITLLAFTLLYYLWDRFVLLKPVTRKLISLLDKPSRELLWFLYAILALYIALPLIKRLADVLSPREELLFIILWAVCNGILRQFELSKTYPVPIAGCAYYLGYFFAGHLIYKYRDSIKPKANTALLTATAVISTLATAGLTWYKTVESGKYCEDYLTYRSIFTMLASLSVFMLIYFGLKEKERPFAVKLSGLSFGVYLLHGFILDVAVRLIDYKSIPAILGIPALVLGAAAVTAPLVWLIRLIKPLRAYI